MAPAHFAYLSLIFLVRSPRLVSEVVMVPHAGGFRPNIVIEVFVDFESRGIHRVAL